MDPNHENPCLQRNWGPDSGRLLGTADHILSFQGYPCRSGAPDATFGADYSDRCLTYRG